MTPEVQAITDALNEVDRQHTTDCIDACEALIRMYGWHAVIMSTTEAVERLDERGERYPP